MNSTEPASSCGNSAGGCWSSPSPPARLRAVGTAQTPCNVDSSPDRRGRMPEIDADPEPSFSVWHRAHLRNSLLSSHSRSTTRHEPYSYSRRGGATVGAGSVSRLSGVRLRRQVLPASEGLLIELLRTTTVICSISTIFHQWTAQR